MLERDTWEERLSLAQRFPEVEILQMRLLNLTTHVLLSEAVSRNNATSIKQFRLWILHESTGRPWQHGLEFSTPRCQERWDGTRTTGKHQLPFRYSRFHGMFMYAKVVWSARSRDLTCCAYLPKPSVRWRRSRWIGQYKSGYVMLVSPAGRKWKLTELRRPDRSFQPCLSKVMTGLSAASKAFCSMRAQSRRVAFRSFPWGDHLAFITHQALI